LKIETIEIHANFTTPIHAVVRLMLDDFIDEHGYCAQHGKEGRNHLPASSAYTPPWNVKS